MIRELIIVGLIGTLGALCLAAGIMGYNGSGDFFHPRLAEKDLALTVGTVGVVLLLLEARLMVPVLKSIASRSASGSREMSASGRRPIG